ncbi:HlyD family type I secretion periplasmic adaptor subunit [Campylobacter sp. 19-13652]|uniref:HlyD family type I secretion periplasmic adaptor subunit n=1 Tax=Campylobacter sp. 19-13652 TaxID=2840180 RepID=UPI001C7905E5|nr:HlyD family type I secretion periplasmic adaptor subunit [Campylobacter sp. 19-13652]BCX79006.1 HlyD family type I secretion periplasmic adaptor subunit [Campylobacter sp. 19-13652]
MQENQENLNSTNAPKEEANPQPKEPVSKDEAKELSKEIGERIKFIRTNVQKKEYDANDLRFMSSLSEAVLAKSSSASRKILYVIFLAIAWLLIWANFAEIDEITRGQGSIVPSGKNQVVQNLEGGIVQEILVKEGDVVKKGQILIRIDNKSFESSFGESEVRQNELEAKFARLKAESNGEAFELGENPNDAMLHEKSLYDSNQAQLAQQENIVKEQIRQKEIELNELNSKINQLKSAYALVVKEKNITEPLFKKGLVSEVEFLQLQRKLSDLKGDLDSSIVSIPRAQAAIAEAKNKLSEVKLDFTNKAKKEFNEVSAELGRLRQQKIGIEDRVDRTLVRSPVNGVVSKLYIHTVSGVIKPGENIAEIVPLEDNLIAEVKVKPSDVAFLRQGLPAMVKVTAYDFSIYGGLEGEVEQISADTETDERGNSWYLVRIKTYKNHLGTDARPLRIIVGMVVSADIITGKKSVLDYLLKPILKVKQAALRER